MATSRCRALVQITPEALQEQLQLPEGSVVVGAEWDMRQHCLVLSVVSPDFPEVIGQNHALNVTYRVESRWDI